MGRIVWLLTLFLTGCTFVTTSKAPLFDETDFAVFIQEGRYSDLDGVQVDVRGAGKMLEVHLTDQTDKASDLIVGVVPTKFPDFGIMQVIDPHQNHTSYMPVHIAGNDVTLLLSSAENDHASDPVFARHEFINDNGVWRRDTPFDRQGLVAFYADLIDGIATDPRWTEDKSHPFLTELVFHRKDPQ